MTTLVFMQAAALEARLAAMTFGPFKIELERGVSFRVCDVAPVASVRAT
jgi:hypothetical protein